VDQQLLGDYELLRQISKGPLGTVYHAEHRFLKRYFSLKVLPESVNLDHEFISRLKKEISPLSKLDHPHLVKIHNVSESNQKYFIVSDLHLDSFGEYSSLLHFLNVYPKAIDEQKVFSILYQLASALDYLHAEGVVHRFVNPHTILVGKEEDGVISIYLDDSGIASIIGEGTLLASHYQMMAEALAISFSQEGDINSLTSKKLKDLHELFNDLYPYLAPEQRVLKPAKPVTNKSDVFSFGVLAYYLLLRDLPVGFFQLPSARLPFQYDWDHLVSSCLNKDPQKRPDNLKKLMEEIKLKAHVIESVEEWKKEQSVSLHEQIRQVKELSPEKPVTTPVREIAKAIEEEQRFEIATKAISRESAIESRLTPPAHAGARFVSSSPRVAPAVSNAPTVLEEPRIEMNTAHLKPKLKPTEIEKPQFDMDPSAIFQTDSVIAPYKPEEKTAVVLQPLQTKMIIIPDGEFYRGSAEGARDEKPFHKIRLSSFAMDIHPVTNEQYVRFLEVMGGEKDYNNNDLVRLRESRIKRSGGKLIIESGYTKHPVVGVTWYGAVAYAKWVGKRLPTEAEWEIAARSLQSDMIYPTGSSIERYQANFFSSDTSPVMSFAPNQIGLYDMAGNVYEWCEDWYDYAYYDLSQIEPENPKGPHQGVYRVLRGGCWKSLRDDMRCSHRHRNNPGSINTTYGFRCAADVVEEF
jgi:formylglycine-generating enzyme required for sulfatase activity